MMMTQSHLQSAFSSKSLATHQANSQLDPAWQLLLTCITPNLNVTHIDRLRHQLINHPPIDWTRVLRLASEQGMTAMLGQIAQKFCSDLLPSHIQKIFQVNAQGTRIRNIFLTQQLHQILDFLSEHGIIAIPYKGPTLLQTVYGDIGIRKFNDLDILVSHQDFVKAKQLLLSQGYQSKEGFDWEESFHHPELNIEIDLHQSLTPSHFSGGIDYKMLLQQLMELQFSEPGLENTRLPVIKPESLFLLLCIYTVKDHCSYKLRLCQLVDAINLLQTTPTFDWDALQKIAKNTGCWRLVLVQLQLLQRISQLDLPSDFTIAIKQDQQVEALAQAIYDRLLCPKEDQPQGDGFIFALQFDDHQFYLKVRERWQHQLVYLLVWSKIIMLFLVTPNQADLEALQLPKQWQWLYYFLHPIRLLWKYTAKSMLNKQA